MKWTDIVFDGPPGHEAGRFVEVEDESRASVGVGEWIHRDDGYWALRLPVSAAELAALPEPPWLDAPDGPGEWEGKARGQGPDEAPYWIRVMDWDSAPTVRQVRGTGVVLWSLNGWTAKHRGHTYRRRTPVIVPQEAPDAE